jgi:hypothetical protein
LSNVSDDDRKSMLIGDFGRPNSSLGNEVLWLAKAAENPINSEPHH